MPNRNPSVGQRILANINSMKAKGKLLAVLSTVPQSQRIVLLWKGLLSGAHGSEFDEKWLGVTDKTCVVAEWWIRKFAWHHVEIH
jgi:hypothetical protein